VEETIRELIEGPSWQMNPIQFLVVDLTLVAGVDISSSEAFVRVQRLLSAKGITLVFCGFTADSIVGNSLRSVDLLGAEGVELFLTFNDAMECACFSELPFPSAHFCFCCLSQLCR
jgi:SulP family sulfate permease